MCLDESTAGVAQRETEAFGPLIQTIQRELGASRTALLLYLAPVYGALGAWAVLGEPPGWYHAAGAALILPSIWLATRPAGR